MFKTANVTETLLALQGDGCVLVDVRTPGEWSNTGIADVWEVYANMVVTKPDMELNSTFINDLETNVDKAKTVYFICHSGQRSQIACGLAKQSGYDDVYNVEGGMMAWNSNGLPMKVA